MTRRFPHYRKVLVAIVCFTVAMALRSMGLLAPWENAWADFSCRLLQHEVPSDVVIVGIDEESLAQLKSWPWHRSIHAALLNRLRQAHPKRVFLDIDFSTPSVPAEDESLGEAIAQWQPDHLVLSAFRQNSSESAGEVVLTHPLEPFVPHATLGSVNIPPGSDSLIREARTEWEVNGTRLPAVFDILSERTGPPAQVTIDYSISPSSFGYVSYADVVKDRVDLRDLTGKTIMVGATAIELGDMTPVPVYRSIPGVVLQALAVQTVRSGEVRRLTAVQAVALLALWCALLGAVLSRRSWRQNLLVGSVLLTGVALAAIWARAHHLQPEAVLLMASLAAGFITVTVLSLDSAKRSALKWASLANKRDALVESIAGSSADCIFCVDHRGRVISSNAAAERLFAASPRQLLETSLAALLPSLSLSEDGGLAALNGRITEHEARALDGSAFPIELSISPVNYKSEELYTVIARDLRERKAKEAQLQYQATHDSLTGLPNRHSIGLALEEALQAVGQARVAVLVMDLMRFKEINDTLGHSCGDQVLQEVARRFNATVGSRGMISRMGGDEFTVMAIGAEDPELSELAERLCASLLEPVAIGELALEVGVNIGIARSGLDGSTAEALLKNADVAMYSAKRALAHFAFYDQALNEHSVRKLALVGELRAAIQHGGLELRYQPQVLLQSGAVESAEALLRWSHSRFGPISPGELIPIAENTDILWPLTEWTLKEALRQIQHWAARGLWMRIAVNLSARVLHDLTLPARVSALLAEHAVPAQYLELEITESAMMHDAQRALAVIQQIRRLGIPVSIDDYGTGFSSLAYLRDLSANTLKLDRAFVSHLETNADDRLIVESTLSLAHSLHLQVVAEGIETEWQANFLRQAGYDFGQGYLFAKALPAEECFAWIQERNAKAATPAARRGASGTAWASAAAHPLR